MKHQLAMIKIDHQKQSGIALQVEDVITKHK
jgi:hypothetical protein